MPRIRFPPATCIVDVVWLVWLRSCPESISDFVTNGLVHPVSDAMRYDSPEAVVMVQETLPSSCYLDFVVLVQFVYLLCVLSFIEVSWYISLCFFSGVGGGWSLMFFLVVG